MTVCGSPQRRLGPGPLEDSSLCWNDTLKHYPSYEEQLTDICLCPVGRQAGIFSALGVLFTGALQHLQQQLYLCVIALAGLLYSGLGHVVAQHIFGVNRLHLLAALWVCAVLLLQPLAVFMCPGIKALSVDKLVSNTLVVS